METRIGKCKITGRSFKRV